MNKCAIIVGILFLLPSLSFAQNEEDALRYSSYQLIGTARHLSLGGAYGAVGADFSSLSHNPAGIALYRRSEFTISPMLQFARTSSSYLGNTTDDNRSNFALGNTGLIMTFPTSKRLDQGPLKSFHLGIGINRLKDFNNRIYIQGNNNENSLLDAYLIYAGNLNPGSLNSFDTRLAFDTYLIDTLPGQPQPTYVNAYSYVGGFTSALQRKSVETSGSMNEWVISGGMNLHERVYVGLTLGFPWIRFNQASNYSEINQTIPRDLERFNYIEQLETNGNGVNIKTGIIARPTDWLRLGVAYHSPTWFTELNDIWRTRMNSYFANGDQFTARSPVGEYFYDLQTPWKFIASGAVFFGNLGFLSADYEFVNYSRAALRPSFDFSEINEIIRKNFGPVNNFRVGTEWSAGMFQFRGGYANYGSPFRNQVNDGSLHSFSAGVGYKSIKYFLDAAFAYSISKLDYYLYGAGNIRPQPAKNQHEFYQIMLTLGYRFE